MEENCKGRTALWARLRGKDTRGRPKYLEKFSSEEIALGLRPDRLLLLSQCADVVLDLSGYIANGADDMIKLRNLKDQAVGYMSVCDPDFDAIFVHNGSLGDPVEFVALSSCAKMAKDIGGEVGVLYAEPFLDLVQSVESEIFFENSAGDYTPKKHYGQPVVFLMHVMLIKRYGPVARRVGLGEVILKKWVGCGPVFKTVVLG